MTTPEQPDTAAEEIGQDVTDDEAGDPAAQDTGDFAEVPEDERSSTGEDHPANDDAGADLTDVTDDGQVVDVDADEAGAG